jgi:hypothetical protein
VRGADDAGRPERPTGPDRPEPDGGRARLRADLMALGRGLDVPTTDGATMAERVLAQIVAEALPMPVREPPGRLERIRAWARRHARILAAALSGVLVVLVLTPPVRAAVVDWFDFGGVEVRYVPDGSQGPDSPDGPDTRGPACGEPVPMAEAARRAGFRPVVPGSLGAPDTVAVTGLPEGRSMVTLCWREGGRTIRLDEFASSLHPYFAKQVRTHPEWLRLNTASSDSGDSDPVVGLWFAEPHLLQLVMLDENGVRWTRSERTAGPTLLWVRGEQVTLRLEGVGSRERARAVAESTLRGSEEPERAQGS